VSGQLWSPVVLTPGITPAPVEYVAMWAPDPVWMCFGEGKIVAPSWIRTRLLYFGRSWCISDSSLHGIPMNLYHIPLNWLIKKESLCVEKKNQLDATEWFIALIICSTCFGEFCAHHQELETICMLLPPMVCDALVAGFRRSDEGQPAMRSG